MNNSTIIFTFKDSTTKEYPSSCKIRGCRHEGKRPIKVEYPNTLDKIYVYKQLLPHLDPREGTAEVLHKPLDKYIEISGKLHELHSNKNKPPVLIINNNIIWYDATRDGDMLTRADAIAKYPEYFI